MSIPASQPPELAPSVPAGGGRIVGEAAGGAPRGGSWRDLDALDRGWAGVFYIRSVTHLDVPAARHLRSALRSLGRRAPEVGRWVSPDQLRWRPVAAHEWEQWLAQTFAFHDEPGADTARVAELNHKVPRQTPLRVLAGPDWISLRMCHSLGDGWTVDHLIGELLTRAAAIADGADADSLAAPWTLLARRDRDRIIRREARSNLRTALWAVRHRGELAGGVYEPVGPELAVGCDRVVELSSGEGFPKVIRRLRDELFPGVSAAAVGMVGLRAAIASVLSLPRPGFECLFNTRDAASGTANAWGNFSAGIYIRPSDDYDPVAVAAEMQRVRTSGLPELAHASLRMRGRKAGTASAEVHMPRSEGTPRMTMSYMQAHNIDPVIPGLRHNESRIGTVSRPNGADSISVQQVECAGRTHIAVSYFPHVYDTRSIHTAIDTFLADPRSCVTDLLRDVSGRAR